MRIHDIMLAAYTFLTISFNKLPTGNGENMK